MTFPASHSRSTGARSDGTMRDLPAEADLLSQIVDLSPNGVLVSDRDGVVKLANRQAAALLGRDPDSLVGSSLAALLDRSETGSELLASLHGTRNCEREEIERVHDDGRSTWISISTRALRDDDDERVGVIAYLRDVTVRREMQRQLERKNEELERYVDSVAHDLRSPLVALLGFTRLLKQDYEEVLDDTGHHFLDRVEEAGRTMEALIHDLLELSRIRRPDELAPLTDPRRILVQVASELKLRLEAAGATLVLPDETPMMRVDPTRLYQVLSNLVGNALAHGLDGEEGSGTVRVDIVERDAFHEIRVADRGRGIPECDHERIFQIFQTGTGVRRGEQSHGIGLAIVKKVAEAYGGRAWVDSRPGEGACFHVLFPAS